MNYVICGPAASGKSTYVREHMGYGDLVVDLDEIYAAIGYSDNHQKPEQLVDIALSVYKYIVDSIKPEENRFPNAWVIANGAKISERRHLRDKLNATIIVLDVSAEECLRRIERDDNRRRNGIPWGKIIKRWWDSYEPGE